MLSPYPPKKTCKNHLSPLDDVLKKSTVCNIHWTVVYNRKAVKQRNRRPMRIKAILDALTLDIRRSGPVRGDWPNYSRLGDGVHHCHLKNGHPTYVAIWQENDGEIRLVEFIYVSTHEKAPY